MSVMVFQQNVWIGRWVGVVSSVFMGFLEVCFFVKPLTDIWIMVSTCFAT